MTVSGGEQNCFVMILRSRVLKVFLIVGLSFMFTAVYVNFFQHPPPDMLLAMNSRAGGSNFGPPQTIRASSGKEFVSYGESNRRSRGGRHAKSRLEDEGDDDDFEEEKEEEVEDIESKKMTVVKRSEDNEDEGGAGEVKFQKYWNTFLQRNNYVVIGAVYDRCENWRVQYGTVVMLQDKENGGVKSRTFVNITLDHVIDGGQFNIVVKYNGKDLYDNYWEICELDEELPPQNRTFDCPVAAGHHTKVKDRHIPNYLPKGRYQTKAWASDEDEKVFACGYSDFTI